MMMIFKFVLVMVMIYKSTIKELVILEPSMELELVD